MHPNARRVADAARSAGLEIEVVEFPDGTRTATDAAAAVDAPVSAIVKSLVFVVDGAAVMALVAGDNRLDETLLAEAAAGGGGGGGGVGEVGRADADLVRTATGFPIGGVPPFGHGTALPTFVDRCLLDHHTVWAAAGTPRHVFEVDPRDLVRVSGAVVADLAAR